MTILTIRTRYLGLAGAASVASMLFSYPVLAGEDANASPHWSKSACQNCHVESAPVAGLVNLQEADAEALCETCHGGRGGAKSCRHMSGIPAGDMTIDESLAPALNDGQVVCSTCHDVVYQCKHARIEYSYQNPGFLRNRTTRRTGEYCLKCHDGSAYEALNPHKGVAGDPPKATCALCHAGVPESDRTGAIRTSFNVEHDLNDTCRGCHNVRPHPIGMTFGSQGEGWVHLVRPSADVFGKIERWQAATGSRLPLSPYNGEIYCATCHDPHEFKGGPVAGQPEHRLRAEDICQVCHDK
jgi:hypothetical protein